MLPRGCSRLRAGPRRWQAVPWRILAGSQEALRRLQDAPTKLPGGSQEARGGSQVVSGSFMFRMSVVFKGSKALGRESAGIYTALRGLCVSKFQGHLCSVGSS